jgi:hypothetical protein
MNVLARHTYWLLCLGIASGCQSAEKPAPTTNVVSKTTTASAAASAKPASTKSTPPTLTNPKVTSAHPAEFKPPFPDRTELFEPPKRAQNVVRRDDEHGQSVELKGFINVDKPRVVLSIDGVISPIPEGGEKYGVQVISIQPPKAVLQRGRIRWTATLE